MGLIIFASIFRRSLRRRRLLANAYNAYAIIRPLAELSDIIMKYIDSKHFIR